MANITEESKDYPKYDNEGRIEKLLQKHNERVPKCSCHVTGKCKGC